MPAGTITTGNHPKALWPGMHAFFGTTYGEYQEEWRDLVEVQKSSKNYEEDTLVTGFGQMPIKPEGSGVSYDSETQGFTKRYTHTVWGLGYIVTQEEMEDNLYEVVSKKRIKRLAFSARQTKENIVANVYNRAFNSSYTGGDGEGSAGRPTHRPPPATGPTSSRPRRLLGSLAGRHDGPDRTGQERSRPRHQPEGQEADRSRPPDVRCQARSEVRPAVRYGEQRPQRPEGNA
jgi:hypothetical protein